MRVKMIHFDHLCVAKEAHAIEMIKTIFLMMLPGWIN
jgi:hypothetical protein